MKATVYLANLICLGIYDPWLEEWYLAAKIRAKREKSVGETTHEEEMMNREVFDGGIPDFKLGEMDGSDLDNEIEGMENLEFEDPDNEF